MADMRALLAAERQSRRITHPHLSYTKSGMLLCNVCNLNVKSETLWEGHLRSANHRKNALASQEITTKPLKRKIEDVDVPQEDRYDAADADSRKKPKSRPRALLNGDGGGDSEPGEENGAEAVLPAVPDQAEDLPPPPAETTSPEVAPPIQQDVTNGSKTQADVDEDEWAAFEREVAPLAAADHAPPPANYEGATITAAPVSAAQLAQQADEEKRRRLDTEAEDEKEDEGRRLEEEFDVMEEMEERVRKLREKREALRQATVAQQSDEQQPQAVASAEEETSAPAEGRPGEQPTNNEPDDDDDDEDDEDDWYR